MLTKLKVMRRFILIVLLFSSCFYTVQGQVIALKAGPVVSKLNCHVTELHDTELDNTYTGVAAIAGIDYLIKKYFCLSTDFGYINSGGKGHTLVHDPDFPGGEHDVKIETNLHFITFNTLVHLQYRFGDHIEPFVGIGPRLDYLLGYHEDAEMLHKFEEVGELNRWLYGAVAAAGVHFDVHHWVLGFEYQYNFDMNELVDYEADHYHKNEVALRCSPFLVTVGYHFGGNNHNAESVH
jgi:outer membrane protein W